MNEVRTSESVAAGHPDKVADIISDAILDLALSKNKHARCSVETMVCTDEVILRGELGGVELSDQEIEDTVREVVKKIGYVDIDGFSFDTLVVNQKIVKQSADIAQGVVSGDDEHSEVIGAGDQGIMFGYATDETEAGLSIPFFIAKELMHIHNCLTDRRQMFGVRPDAKAQFTMQEGNNVLVLAISHDEDADVLAYSGQLLNMLLEAYPEYEELFGENCTMYINSTGKFIACGPSADTGLTGRKIVCDSYGGVCPVGGGAFSSKDPSKVDRSAAYMARHLALKLIKTDKTPFEGTKEVLVGLSYAIGVAQPTSVSIETNFLSPEAEKAVSEAIQGHYDLTPAGIIDYLKLRDVLYVPTAFNGHFGRKVYDDSTFTWESVDSGSAI